MHLPIGISDFRTLVEYKDPAGVGCLFVDKTALIKEIIYDSTGVIVFTRPRRFGKTLNLSMLQYFFAAEVGGRSTKGLFDGLEISKHPECMDRQGQFSVIYITLKDVKADNISSAMNKIYEQVRQLYVENRILLESNVLLAEEKLIYKSILDQSANFDVLSFSLRNLSAYLKRESGKEVYILIDEYDTPIQEAYLHGYYDELVSFMRGFLGSALKDNTNLKQAIITGILRVARESLFSDLNNVKVYSIFNSKYSNYFGFTGDEVNALLDRAKLPAKTHQLKEWYNGYNFGGTTIYNPWSIIFFISESGKLMSYWVNTSGNDLIRDIVINGDPAIKDDISNLIAGKDLLRFVDEHMVFGDLQQNKTAVWSLLLMSGYLKAISIKPQGRRYLCELLIPNKEVEDFFTSVVQDWLSGARGFEWYREFLGDIAEGRAEALEEKLQMLIDEVFSCHDVKKNTQESFYHGLMLAFVSGLKETHEVKSNRESGKGRYDVAIIPRDVNKLGVVMEFKAVAKERKLSAEAAKALRQIEKSAYTTELKVRGINRTCKMGVAFSGKSVKIISKM